MGPFKLYSVSLIFLLVSSNGVFVLVRLVAGSQEALLVGVSRFGCLSHRYLVLLPSLAGLKPDSFASIG